MALFVLVGASGCGDPDEVERPATLSESCIDAKCHGAVEQIHYGGPRLRCVDCHGGDDTDFTKEGAHVTVDVSFNPSTPGNDFMGNPTLEQLDNMDKDALQFINPADYRVAKRSCGADILHGVGCHATITDNSMLLNRATLAGTYAGGGYISGIQDKQPIFGVVGVTDLHVPPELPEGVVASLKALPADVPANVTDPIARAIFPMFEQLCTSCHVNQDGAHAPGLYYSSGCNACHMKTDDDARARTADITQDVDELGHVSTHRFTNEIPDSQCARCHISHLARSMLAQGVREKSEEGDGIIGGPHHGIEDPEHAVWWGKENYVKYEGLRWIYGKPYPFYIEDEDGRNDVDETPPDVHTAKGMACIDCHNIFEAHGDRHADGRMDFELDVRCESCHGRPGQLATRASDRGLSFTKSGTSVGERGANMAVFADEADGSVSQMGKLSKKKHPVTQITRRTEPADKKFNPRTRMGCELHAGTAARRKQLKTAVNALSAKNSAAVATDFPGLPAGFTFTEMPEQESDGRVECFACHNSWTVNCYGCHVVRDDRETYTSRIDGKVKKGRMLNLGLSTVADALAMGFNVKGKITPMVGTAIFFTHFDENGKRVIDAAPLTTAEGLKGDGNVHNPVHHHTIQRQPRDCDGCHPSTSDSHDVNALLRAVGLGTGEFIFTDGGGVKHLLDRMVMGDWDGDGKWDDPTKSGLPAKLTASKAVVGTTHVRASSKAGGVKPGPLDLETINRVLLNHVLPQRPKAPKSGK